jgi:hypothetical protein
MILKVSLIVEMIDKLICWLLRLNLFTLIKHLQLLTYIEDVKWQLKWTNVKGVSRNPEMRWSENVSFLLINFLIQKFRTSDKLTFYLADFFIDRSVLSKKDLEIKTILYMELK